MQVNVLLMPVKRLVMPVKSRTRALNPLPMREVQRRAIQVPNHPLPVMHHVTPTEDNSRSLVKNFEYRLHLNAP